MKMFKAKRIAKRKRKGKLKVLLFTFFFFFSYVFMFFYSKEYKYEKSILYKDINYIDFNFFNTISDKIDEKINKPVNLLNNNIRVFNNDIKKENKVKKVSIVNSAEELSKQEDIYNPIVYVYNTHQSEKYIDYSVYDASLELANKLNQKGLDTYFEEQSVTAFLQSNNLKYYKSYTVSRRYLEEAKKKYNNLNYFFDIHRDALSKEKSTSNINGVSYAKILFVIGKKNVNYENNLSNAKRLNEIINNKVPGISRGVITKEGEDVNGIYNQDMSSNVFLIEVGGNNNTKEEVLRTIDILCNSLEEYIKGVL